VKNLQNTSKDMYSDWVSKRLNGMS